MNQGFVKVCAVTPKIKVADPKYNSQVICTHIQEATEKGAKIIVFPELCITGYSCGDLFLQELLLEEAKRQLLKIAEVTQGEDNIVIVGLPIERDGRLYNVAALIQGGMILGMVPKRNIPQYSEFYEGRYFSEGSLEVSSYILAGEEIPFGVHLLFECLNIRGLTIGCEICEDMWVPDSPGEDHALMGATVIANLSASTESVNKDEYREMLVKSTSARLLCGYIYASAGDGESTQDVVYSGHNMICENGFVLGKSTRFLAEAIYGDVDVARINMERRRMGTFGREKELNYVAVPFRMELEETRLDREFSPTPFIPDREETKRKRCEDILWIQSLGLKKRYEHTGCKCGVIGVSGGLDSTLALLVTVRTFDMLGLSRNGILAVTMPCFGTTNRTYDNACKLAEMLGVTLKKVNIKKAVEVHFEDIGQDSSKHDVTYENAQARERTQVLMDIANQENGLVIGTGDMSELALGWATYNGDHMSMYGVNAGVPKTLVRHLVTYCADTSDNKELKGVLEDILDTPVSPELLPPTEGNISQITEDLVGPYELHDFFLYYMLRCGFPPKKVYRIAKKAFESLYEDQEILKWMKVFYRRFFQQQFKRSCLPDGPKIGSVSLSPRGDLRMPSDASASLWLEELEALT